MFTGIVEERGYVSARAGSRLIVTCRGVAADAVPGASMAVNGVCLTVVEHEGGDLAFDLAPETLARSTLGTLEEGDPVNLERPLTLAARIGGHLVQGHVDAVGRVEDVDNASGTTMRISLANGLGRYIVEKGSVAVDGVSLTVASVENGAFTVALVPHTLSVTTLGDLRPGDRVNLEVDVLAKYVESLVGRTR